MPQPYLKPIIETVVLRGPAFRDDNFNSSSWGQSTTGTVNALVETRDGHTLKVQFSPGSGGNDARSWTRTVPGTLSTTTYSKCVFRFRTSVASSGIAVRVQVITSGGSNPISGLLFSKDWDISTLSLPSGETLTSITVFFTDEPDTLSSGTFWGEIDFVAICKDTPVELHQNDLVAASVTRATLTADDFTLVVNNEDGVNLNKLAFPSVASDRQNIVYIWLGYLGDDLATRNLYRVFGGKMEELTPSLSKQGDVLTLAGRGWARGLLRVLVNNQYGTDSANPTLDNLVDIVDNIIDTINTSGNGYQLTKDYIQTYSPSDPTVVFLRFVNTKAFQALSQIMDLYTAVGDDVQLWVDPSENVHRTRLTDWGSDPNNVSYPNALNVGRDQIVNDFRQDSYEEVNQLRYLARLWIPGDGDLWTESTSGWTAGASTTVTTSPTLKSVGTKSVFFFRNVGAGAGDASMSRSISPAIDATRLGGTLIPPRLNMYLLRHQNITNVRIRLEKDASNYFQLSLPDSEVTAFSGSEIPKRFSITIGPNSVDRWIGTGSPDWAQINTFRIIETDATDSSQMFIDGLALEGQRAFTAKDSTRINQYDLGESSVVDNMGRGQAALKDLAKAELFRLRNPVLRGTIRVPGIPDILPGQKVTVNAASAGFTNKVLRVLEVRHSFSRAGFTTELDLSDDFTSYQPLEPVRAANMLLEVGISPYRKRQEQGAAFTDFDPSIPFETTDYPS